jgi:hypothetical protein
MPRSESPVRAPRLVWYPQPKQHALISCPVEDVLFGGARGGGKTDGLAGDWLAHAQRYGPAARGLFFRQSYPELEEVEQRLQEIFPAIGGTWQAGKRTWQFTGGARLRLRYLLHEKDAQNFQGQSNSWIGGDELGNYPTPKIVDLLRATLRSPVGIPCYFRGSANPGGVGHGWLRARYVDPAPPMTPFAVTETIAGETITVKRCYIPSTLEDNALLVRNDPGYWQRIVASAGGNEALIKAWRYGDWDVVAGGMLDDVWDARYHVVEPFDIPTTWRIRRAFDWGSSKPFSCGWWAHSDGETPVGSLARVYLKGTRFRIHEYYGWNGKPNEGLRMTNTEIARKMKAIEDASPYHGRIEAGPADSSIFDVVNGVSIAHEIATQGISFKPAQKGPGSRRQGWQVLRQLLKASTRWPMEEPGMFVFNTCRQFLRTVPVAPRDPADSDDIDCFVAGTLINTPYGATPIEDLQAGDLVDTPIGPREVLKAGIAGDASTCHISCADGTILEGTFDHKIFVNNIGLLPLCRLSLGDELLLREDICSSIQPSIEALHFGSMPDDGILSVDLPMQNVWDPVCSIALSGSQSTGPFPQGMTSTIETMIEPITRLTTWNSSLRGCMHDAMHKSALHEVGISSYALCAGVKAMKGRPFFGQILSHAVTILPSENLRALIVASLLERSILARNIALMPVALSQEKAETLLLRAQSAGKPGQLNPMQQDKPKPVVTNVVGNSASKKVYYLTIEQSHLFYANGVLSANTDSEDHILDETRYECSMSLPGRGGQVPVKGY